MRLFTKFKILINKIIALVIVKVFNNKKQKWEFKNVWLLGGSLGRLYNDNSAVLHKYLIEKHDEITPYWVINKDSKHLTRVRNVARDKILYRGSIKANIYALNAEVHVVSHSKMDISFYKRSYFQNTTKVHLGHGVQGLKKMKLHPKLKRTLNKDFNIFPVNSEVERTIKVSWGIDPEKVFVTGMPRCDKLNQYKSSKANLRKTRIFYMPTWRDWILKHEDLCETDYYKNIFTLLNNINLLTMLKTEKLMLDVYLHVNMRKYFECFQSINSEHINILPVETDIQNKIIDSDLLITDYSSVCWDFLYLNKPVIFYQFDKEKYLKERGSYINLNNELFGPNVYKAKDVVKYLNEWISSRSFFSSKSEWKAKMFQYEDENNSQRIVDLIFIYIRKGY